MMNRLLCISALFIWCLGASAQKWEIRIGDKSTGESIENAHVIFTKGNSDSNLITDKNGVVCVIGAVNQKIRISHISYNDTTISICFQDPGKIIVRLSTKITRLEDVEITTSPVCLFSAEHTHVFDFEVRNDTLVVLTYRREKMFRRQSDQSNPLYLGCELFLISPSGRILDSLALPDFAQSIYKDPFNNIWIRSKREIFLLNISPTAIWLSEADEKDFETFVEPLDGISAHNYFFNDFQWDYPQFGYYRMNKLSGERELIRIIEDKFTMELFRAEYKYLSNPEKLKAMRLESSTGIDKEIFGAYMSGFTHHPYYQMLYAPLFNYGDSILIFDHHSNHIFLHNGCGNILDSIPIAYHHWKGFKFKNEIINDAIFNSFYAIFEKSGIKLLRKIDPFSGRCDEPIHLYHSYPEKIKVNNQKAFYLYRKFGDTAKHLFLQQL